MQSILLKFVASIFIGRKQDFAVAIFDICLAVIESIKLLHRVVSNRRKRAVASENQIALYLKFLSGIVVLEKANASSSYRLQDTWCCR